MKANIFRTLRKNDYDEYLENTLKDNSIPFEKQYVGAEVEYSLLINNLEELLGISRIFEEPLIISNVLLNELDIEVYDTKREY